MRTSHNLDATLISELSAHDPGWRAALHVLRTKSFLRDPRVWAHVKLSGPDRGIYFDAMLRDGRFSTGERLLLEVGWSLFDGGASLALDDVACRLDEAGLELVFEAIALRASSMHVHDVDMSPRSGARLDQSPTRSH